MTLSERIRFLRRSRVWTQKQLADYADVSKSYISALEDGELQPESAHIEAIAKAFDLPLVDLLSGLDEPGSVPEDVPTLDCGDVDVVAIVEQGETEASIGHGKSAIDGKEEKITVIDRQVTTHVFTAPPARVGAEFKISFQVSSEKWAGLRVWTERPCAPEDVGVTREAVINETRAALDHQYRRSLHEEAAAYRLEQPGIKIV